MKRTVADSVVLSLLLALGWMLGWAAALFTLAWSLSE